MLFGICIESISTALMEDCFHSHSPCAPTALTLFESWLCVLHLSIVTVLNAFRCLYICSFLARGSPDPVESRGGRAQLAPTETL